MTRNHRLAFVLGSLALLAGALALGYWWGQRRLAPAASNGNDSASAEPKALYWYDPMVPDQHFDKPGKSPFMDMQLVPKYAEPTQKAEEANVLYWYDPMVPDQHFDKPGKSPFMDMQLVPKYAETGASSEGGVTIPPGVRQNLGMRTAVVSRGSLASTIRVPGTIGWDLRQERVVSARVDSIVERLYVKAPYETVRAGQPLATVLSSTWSTALAEARALANATSPEARALRSAAQQRLRVLGLPAGAPSTRGGSITLTSPVSGVVSEIGVREGESAPMGTLLFRVNGTRTVWLEAAVPQSGAGGIAADTPVEASVDAIPGEVFSGRVETLLPQVDTGNRTQQARIVLDNTNGLLAPGMFAQITLKPDGGVDLALVPSEALIGSGAQSRVIVLGDDNKFRPVAVQPGRSSGGMTEVLSGLEGGERVVVSGQFLIDSESNLSGALERLGMQASGPEGVAKPDADGAAEVAAPDVKSMELAVAPRRPEKRERKAIYWYDPMVPDQHFDKPGKSPFMDMQLVPKYADEDGEAESPP